jgi:predicted CXXCH cytochrome family protein
MPNRLLISFCIIILCTFNKVLVGQSLPNQKETDDQCIICHLSAGDKLEKMANDYKQSIHFEKGIGCTKCHGGDASSEDINVSMSKEKGFIGIPKRFESYKLCVKCHSDQNVMNKYGSKLPTDQFAKLQMSVHSKQTIGKNEMIADCITCHGVHNIVSDKNPSSSVYPTKIVFLCGSCHSNPGYMKNYNSKLPVDQIEKYKTSVHGKLNQQGNIDAAECVSCHGNHEIRNVNDPKSLVYATNIPQVCSKCHSDEKKMKKYNIPTNQYSLFVNSVHGQQLLKKMDLNAPSCNDCHGNHGAVPPGVESISNVCGTCHSLNEELFTQSPHKKIFDEKNIPECEICHGNHGIHHTTDNMFGIGEASTCIKCHNVNDKNKGFIIAKIMRSIIDSLKSGEYNAQKIVNEAAQKGMDVSDASFALKDIKQVLIESRTILHSANLEKYKESVQKGFEITSKAEKAGQDAIDNYYFRRKGLGIVTIVVTFLVILLYLKIRRLEKK